MKIVMTSWYQKLIFETFYGMSYKLVFFGTDNNQKDHKIVLNPLE